MYITPYDLNETQRRDLARAKKRLREEMQESFGIDPAEVQWRNPRLTIKGIRESLRRRARGFMQEAVAATAFAQLLRYGVQNFLFGSYRLVPTVYSDIVAVRPSGNRQEFYAPMYRSEMPKPLKPGEDFPESQLRGIDKMVVNQKYGRLLSIQRELIDDDQTGQISSKAAEMGQMVKYREEYDVMTKLQTGSFYSYASYGNRPAAWAALSQPALENADIALSEMLDPLGNRMLVIPDTLLVGSANKFTAARLLNSTLQPSVPGATGETFLTASSGHTSGIMAVNPLQGLYKLRVSFFLNRNTWILLQAKTGIVLQDRDALEVMQENPASGASFQCDEYRFRVRRRYATDIIEPRFQYAGWLPS